MFLGVGGDLVLLVVQFLQGRLKRALLFLFGLLPLPILLALATH